MLLFKIITWLSSLFRPYTLYTFFIAQKQALHQVAQETTLVRWQPELLPYQKLFVQETSEILKM
jgi:hypothetical protein